MMKKMTRWIKKIIYFAYRTKFTQIKVSFISFQIEVKISFF